MSSSTHPGIQERHLFRYTESELFPATDAIAIEEPLEIRLVRKRPGGRRQSQSLTITMRTPGHDIDLAFGLLFSEGIIGRKDHVQRWSHTGGALAPEARENVLTIELDPTLDPSPDFPNRNFYAASSCGVCGKASIEMVRTISQYYPRSASPVVTPDLLLSLPEMLRGAQSVFEQTGGIHAAGLFSTEGNLLLLREDIGRHNALDKLIGAALQTGLMPLRDHVVMTSGRIGFELVQKCSMAGVPLLAAVGAPSSLAIELAEESEMTLVGFLRDGRFNVYTGAERISIPPHDIPQQIHLP